MLSVSTKFPRKIGLIPEQNFTSTILSVIQRFNLKINVCECERDATILIHAQCMVTVLAFG